jgi:tyrosyl-tRNA synthetase
MGAIVTGLVSAVISFLVAFFTSRSTIYSKDVTEERQKWRERIRQLAIEAVQFIRSEDTQSKEYQTIVSEFYVRLNPDDINDNEILETLQKCIQAPNETQARKILAQVSRLLKHDWERAKTEARLCSFTKPNEKEIRRLRSSDYLP